MNSGKAIHRTATLKQGRKSKGYRKKMRKDLTRKRAEKLAFEASAPTLVKSVDGFGEMYLDALGKALNTGYERFRTGPAHGLAKVSEARADVLSIDTIDHGKGHCRVFFDNLKTIYPEIYVWEVWNPLLATALLRWGFTACEMVQDGEHLDGFVWRQDA